MNSKKILFLCLFALMGGHLYAAKVIRVINASSENVLLKYEQHAAAIKPGETKNLLINVPFTSRQKNFIDFVQDRPYVAPHNVQITTHEGIFYMWCDERGIVVAKAFVRGMSRQEALPQVFLSLAGDDLSRVVGCIVTVSKRGDLSIKKS